MKRLVITCGALLIALSASTHVLTALDELLAGRGSDLNRDDPVLFSKRTFLSFSD